MATGGSPSVVMAPRSTLKAFLLVVLTPSRAGEPSHDGPSSTVPACAFG